MNPLILSLIGLVTVGVSANLIKLIRKLNLEDTRLFIRFFLVTFERFTPAIDEI